MGKRRHAARGIVRDPRRHVAPGAADFRLQGVHPARRVIAIAHLHAARIRRQGAPPVHVIAMLHRIPLALDHRALARQLAGQRVGVADRRTGVVDAAQPALAVGAGVIPVVRILPRALARIPRPHLQRAVQQIKDHLAGAPVRRDRLPAPAGGVVLVRGGSRVRALQRQQVAEAVVTVTRHLVARVLHAAKTPEHVITELGHAARRIGDLFQPTVRDLFESVGRRGHGQRTNHTRPPPFVHEASS